MTLKDEILKVLDDGEYCKVSKLNTGFELEYGKSYDAPSVSFKKLKALSEIFGTDKIDVDDYCYSDGCSTCGYGSDYGHTIQIYDATKNVNEMNELVGKDLKK